MKPMRRFACLSGVLILIACTCLSASAEEPGWITSYNRLLHKYVTPSGVRYGAWKSDAGDLQALDGVVNGIANEKTSSMNRDAQLAFYINAYNAWILHEALEKYPTRSVKDTFFTFFTGNRIRVAGEAMSFNRLEKDVIRSKFADPRVHFALNCASRSCPPLLDEAFAGDKVEAQMEKLAKSFVNSDRGVDYKQSSNTAALSKIFDWYNDDFAKEGGSVAFINKRRSNPLPGGTKITYQDYNWALNDAK